MQVVQLLTMERSLSKTSSVECSECRPGCLESTVSFCFVHGTLKVPQLVCRSSRAVGGLLLIALSIGFLRLLGILCLALVPSFFAVLAERVLSSCALSHLSSVSLFGQTTECFKKMGLVQNHHISATTNHP